MKTATISLKQLRTDPRHLVHLINLGQSIDITEHGRVIASANPRNAQPKKGNTAEILKLIKTLPPTHMLDPNEPDTVKAFKKAKLEALESKLERVRNQK